MKVDASLDNQEITSMQLTDPNTILQNHIEGKLWLAPPQIWEISRMSNFCKFEDLKSFAKERECHGCETWLPVLKLCSDGHYSVYPGDDMYPETPDYEGKQSVEVNDNESVYDQTFDSQNLNRMLQLGPHDYSIHVNVKDPFGHMVPISASNPFKT